MEIRRTANAGVLLKLDDVQILLDGVCQAVFSYLATPPALIQALSDPWPDAVAFTHTHDDHYDGDYIAHYRLATGREVVTDTASVGGVTLYGASTRHMGKWGLTTPHCSFAVCGSKTVWFLGDAAPTQLKVLDEFPKPDVLIVPYPYVSTPAAIRQLEAYLSCKIVLLHLPLRENDPEGIWQTVAPGLEQLKPYLYVPALGETINL